MSGLAVFNAIQGDRLRYHETGSLTLSEGRSFHFERRYIYEANRDALRILFDEPSPRLFQHIMLSVSAGEPRGHGLHLCSPDVYRSTYKFSLPGSFRIVHHVDGPRKSHSIDTIYHRPTSSRSEPSK
jgi:hypothetical protein